MKTTFLIGNGYDKAIGLDTGYSEFLDYYVNLKSGSNNPEVNELIDRMKDDIKENRTLWADLEITLGKYTEKFDDWEKYSAVYDDINNELRLYIEKEQNRLGKEIKFSQKAAIAGFADPTQLLEPADKERMISFFNTYGANSEINVISLNYTNTIEQELKALESKHQAFNINQILHLHGKVDDTIILGVSDEKQIANSSFREKKYLKDFLIKSQTNKTMKSRIDVLCKNLISTANLFVTFGVSLGESDNYIWREIGNQLTRGDFKLIIFQYDPSKDFTHRKWKLGKAEDEIRDKFLKKAGIKGDVNPKMRDNIIVAFNKPLFGISDSAESNER